MKYITGQQALNIPCNLDTCGDWHSSALRWDRLNLRDSENSAFGDYGISVSNEVPTHKGNYYVANHIRAILDLLNEGKFCIAQGMRDDYICNDKYDNEVFSKVILLQKTKIGVR